MRHYFLLTAATLILASACDQVIRQCVVPDQPVSFCWSQPDGQVPCGSMDRPTSRPGGARRLRTVLAKRWDKHSVEYCGRNRCVTEAGETRSRVNPRSCCGCPHPGLHSLKGGTCVDDFGSAIDPISSVTWTS